VNLKKNKRNQISPSLSILTNFEFMESMFLFKNMRWWKIQSQRFVGKLILKNKTLIRLILMTKKCASESQKVLAQNNIEGRKVQNCEWFLD